MININGKEISEEHILIWDRQDMAFQKFRDYNYDAKSNKHYFKYHECNLWLEDMYALDVLIIDKRNNALIPFALWA